MGGAVFPPWYFSVSVQLLSLSDSLWPHESKHTSLSITNSQSPLKPMSIYLGPNYDGGNENNGYLLQKVHAHTQCPDTAAGHCQPTPRLRLLNTHGPVWVSLLWCHCSFLLCPGAQSFVCALQECVSPVLCKFWGLYGGVNGDLLQEGLCHTMSIVPRVPAPVAVHRWPVPPQETLKHSKVFTTLNFRVFFFSTSFLKLTSKNILKAHTIPSKWQR